MNIYYSMAIILRTVKGTSLTYEEMDGNLSQFAYSGSVVKIADQHTLYLHYTGSNGLGYVPRAESIDITPFPYTGSAEITGSLILLNSGNEDMLKVKVGVEDKMKINGEGVIVFQSQSTPPTPVAGGLYFGIDENYYLGFH